MTTFQPDHLDVITRLAIENSADSLRELESRERLTIALRDALRYGADINDLSAITGLTPIEIRRRGQRESERPKRPGNRG